MLIKRGEENGMIKRKFCSLLLIISLCVTMFPLGIFAASPGAAGTPGKVQLYMDFLGSGAEASHPKPGAAQSVGDLQAGDVFWIGIRAKDMTKDKWPILADHGLETWIMTLNFDTAYVKPYAGWDYKANNKVGTDLKKFKGSVEKHSFGEWPDGYKFTDGTAIDQACKFDKAEPSILTDKTHARALKLGIEINVNDYGNAGMRFYGNTDGSDTYLFRVPFIVQALPAAGTRVLEVSLEPESFNVSFMDDDGNSNTEWTGLWEVPPAHEKTFKQNMRNWIYFNGNIDLFPAAEVPTGATASLSNLDKLTNGQPIEGLKDLKVHVTYPTNPAVDKNPTKIGYGNAGLTDNDVASLTEITTPFNADNAMNGKHLYAYYQEGTFKKMIDLGVMTVTDPVQSIDVTMGTTSGEYGNITYKTLFDNHITGINATLGSGTVSPIAKTDAGITWKINGQPFDKTSMDILKAGTYDIEATYKGATSPKKQFTVNKRDITVTLDPNHQTKVYGTDLDTSALTVKVDGALASESNTLKANVKFTHAITKQTNVGDYDITLSANTNEAWKNYNVTFTAGQKIRVTKKPINYAATDKVRIGPFRKGETASTVWNDLAAKDIEAWDANNVKLKITLGAAPTTGVVANDVETAITAAELTGTAAGNYDLQTKPAKAIYNVNDDPVKNITDINMSSVVGNYGDITPKAIYDNITDIAVGLESGATSTVAKDAAGVTWELDGNALNKADATTLLDAKAHTLKVTYQGKTFEKTFTVNKKAITVALNAGQTKVYGADLGALTVNITGAAAADEAALKADVKFAGVDKKTKVGSHNITLDKTTESVWKNYNPTFTPGQINVTKKPINYMPAEKINIGIFKKGSSPALTIADLTAKDIEAWDAVKLKVTVDAINTAAVAANLEANITAAELTGEADVIGNYDLNTNPAKAVYSVIDKAITGISLIDEQDLNFIEGKTVSAADLGTLKLKVDYDDNTSENINAADFAAKGVAIKAGTNPITLGTTPADKAWNGLKLKVEYAGKSAEGSKEIKVNDKAISALTIKNDPTKMEYTVGEKIKLAGLKIKVDYNNGTFDDNVTYDADNKNSLNNDNIKVFVGDVEVTKDTVVTADMIGKNITVKVTDTIKQDTNGTLTVKAKKPEAEIDAKTNAVKVKDPQSGFVYAIVKTGDPAPAAGAYAAAPAGGFTGLDANTSYTVYAKLANDAGVSSAVSSDPVKTFKNKVVIKDKTEAVIGTFFMDDGNVAKADVDKHVTGKVVEDYYKEKALTTKVVFPLNVTTDTVLFAKIKSGGGGFIGPATPGTSEKIEITLSPSPVNGIVGEKGKITATVKGTTKPVTWSSSDEKIVKVDKDGNLEFIAKGEAEVTASVEGVSAKAKVIVTDADESLIDENFMKPYIIGLPDGTFGPERDITRGEVAAIIARILKVKMDPNATYSSSYSDVKTGEWYANYVGFLSKFNIIKGYPDGTFKANNKVTRSELVAMMARAARYKESNEAPAFSDVSANYWAKGYIAVMSQKKIIAGYPDGTFGPDRNISRAETVKIINNMLVESEAVTNKTFPDVTSTHWASDVVLKSANERRAVKKK